MGEGGYICFPKKLSFFGDNWIVSWLRVRDRILFGIPKRRAMRGCSLPFSLSSLLPPPGCMYRSVLLAGGIRKQKPWCIFWFTFTLALFCVFSPLQWLTHVSLHTPGLGRPDSPPGRAEQFLLAHFCVKHKSLCLKLVLGLVHKAETRSVLKGHCIWIFLQEGSFTGVVINRSCFFCRTRLRGPECAGQSL